MFEPVGFIAGFDDVAVMSDAVEHGGRHLGIGKDLHPFREGQIGGDDQTGAFIELADQVEQQSTARLRERQIPRFIEDHQIHDIEEANPLTTMDHRNAQGRGQVVFPRAGTAYQG